MREGRYISVGVIISQIAALIIVAGFFVANKIGIGAYWDSISLFLIFIPPVLLYYLSFNSQYSGWSSDKEFYLYKIYWLRDIFILFGACATFLGMIFMWGGFNAMPTGEGSDLSYSIPSMLSGSMAVAMITMLYGISAAASLKFTYLITKNRFNNISPNQHSKKKGVFTVLITPAVLLLMGAAAFLCSMISGMPLSQFIEIHQIVLLILILLFSYMLPDFSIKSAVINCFAQTEENSESLNNQIQGIISIKKFIYALLIFLTICAPFSILISIMYGAAPFLSLAINLFLSSDAIFLGLFILCFLTMLQGKYSQAYYATSKKLITEDNSFFYLVFLLFLWIIILSVLWLSSFIML